MRQPQPRLGSLAIGINRFQDASVLLTPASRIGSVWAAGAVLAVTLALVGWTHLRLMTALGEARRAHVESVSSIPAPTA